MSYDVNKLARLKHLKEAALKTKETTDALGVRIKALEDVGAQANVIESIKVNGTAQDTTYTEVTQSANGLMTASDKTKLDGMTIATDAEVTEMLTEVFGATA